METQAIKTLREHLHRQYAGIFDETMIQAHIDEYVDVENAQIFAEFLAAQGYRGKKMLDIGCGYGANILAARDVGMDACGIELEKFEVQFARDQLNSKRPQDDAETVYLQGSAMALPFPDAMFDLVTIMNVLEHVPDYRKLLEETARVLKPGGRLYAVCPNYLAFRREAHYLVPWIPLLPRRLARIYLRLLGRNPGFFEQCIHYCTNWGVLKTLVGLRLRASSQDVKKLENLSLVRNVRVRHLLELVNRWNMLWLPRLLLTANFYNPFKHSVNLYADKRMNCDQ